MKKGLFNTRAASSFIIIICLATMIFHLMVLGGIVPSNIVWGGKITNADELIMFEIVSLIINGLMLVLVLAQARHRKTGKYYTMFKVLFWLLTGVFCLNTIGNLAAENKWETIIFTPITILLALACGRLAIEKK